MRMNHMGMSETGMEDSAVGSHMGGSGMGNSSMDGMMKMYFHTGIVEYILFEQLHTHTAEGFAWACIVVFVVAFLYELMKYGREELFRQHHVRLMHTALSGNEEERSLLMRPKARMCSTGHLLQTALHGLQLVISYCLMLVFMTYNVYLCLSLVAGATLGYFLVGWKRSMVVDQTQHCE